MTAIVSTNPTDATHADLADTLSSLDGVTVELKHQLLGSEAMVTVSRTLADDEVLLIGDTAGDGLGFDWLVHTPDGDEDVTAEGMFTLAAVAADDPDVVDVDSYLADEQLRHRVRDAAVQLVCAFRDNQPERLVDIPHLAAF